jgi:hypothetical protein
VKTVYTAIFGNYDDLKQPRVITQNWKYICYTDQDFDLPEDNVWEIRKVSLINNDPIKTARWYKINFHKAVETEFSLWIDATFLINVNLTTWWKKFRAPFTTIKHPFDDCIFTDIESCLRGGKGKKSELERQRDFYLAIGMQKKCGLIASGILFRQLEPKTIEMCKTWWYQVKHWSSRDQVGFGYAQWKHPGVHRSIEWNYTARTEFIHIPHLHKPSREKVLNQLRRYDCR